MESRNGCLSIFSNWVAVQPAEEKEGGTDTVNVTGRSRGEGESVTVDIEKDPTIEASMTSNIPSTSVEVFAMPGHGRTSFLWAMLYMLRQLSRVWPGYLCWPLDEPTGRSLLDIHKKLQLGLLPNRWEFDKGQLCRHALHLRNMTPWGERYFVVWDWPDEVFASEHLGSLTERKALDWNVPALWLLSLADLDEVRGRFLDLALDDIVRVRFASGEAAREQPFRLIVVLTKGDAIADLPRELRCFLKEDPLAKALAANSAGLFRAHDGINLGTAASYREFESLPDDPIHRVLRGSEFDRRIHSRLVEFELCWASITRTCRRSRGRAEVCCGVCYRIRLCRRWAPCDGMEPAKGSRPLLLEPRARRLTRGAGSIWWIGAAAKGRILLCPSVPAPCATRSAAPFVWESLCSPGIQARQERDE